MDDGGDFSFLGQDSFFTTLSCCIAFAELCASLPELTNKEEKNWIFSFLRGVSDLLVQAFADNNHKKFQYLILSLTVLSFFSF